MRSRSFPVAAAVVLSAAGAIAQAASPQATAGPTAAPASSGATSASAPPPVVLSAEAPPAQGFVIPINTAFWPAASSSASAAPARPSTPVGPELPADAAPHASVLASPWFWGVVGVVAAAGLGAYVLTRDEAQPTVHLQGKVAR